ncbi:MAG TPA: hypothetical protein VGF39_09860, partial [Stellaceae bacterium]
HFGPLTPSARSGNLIAGDGTRNGLSAPNKEPATNKKPLDRKTPIQVSCEFVQRPPDQHYAFLSDAEFDAALPCIRATGVKHYANFRRERPGEINHLYGGRGVYFDDPNGHLLEPIRPYPRGGMSSALPLPARARTICA